MVHPLLPKHPRPLISDDPRKYHKETESDPWEEAQPVRFSLRE